MTNDEKAELKQVIAEVMGPMLQKELEPIRADIVALKTGQEKTEKFFSFITKAYAAALFAVIGILAYGVYHLVG